MKINEKIDNLNQMSLAELHKELDKTYSDARSARLELAANKKANISDIKYKRKLVARILTIINHKMVNQGE